MFRTGTKWRLDTMARNLLARYRCRVRRDLNLVDPVWGSRPSGLPLVKSFGRNFVRRSTFSGHAFLCLAELRTR